MSFVALVAGHLVTLVSTFKLNAQPQRLVSEVMTAFGKVKPLVREDDAI